MSPTSGRRLLGLLVALTLALLVADLAGSRVGPAVRHGAGTLFGPVQRAVSGASHDQLATLGAENVRLRTEVSRQATELAEVTKLRALLDSGVTAGRPLVTARVVAGGVGVAAGRRLTLDAGSRDGIRADSTVVAADGLVGRVVDVSAWTSEVQVLGSPGAVVGVRVGASGRFATVGPWAASGQLDQPPGSLTLTLVQPGGPAVGDLVRTAGSVNDAPYAAGVLVGTVTSIDPERAGGNRAMRTGLVRPAVDLDALGVVAVLAPAPRRTPRPAVTASRSATTR